MRWLPSQCQFEMPSSFADSGILDLSESLELYVICFQIPVTAGHSCFEQILTEALERSGSIHQILSDAFIPLMCLGDNTPKGGKQECHSVCVCGVSVGPAHVAPQAQVGLMFVLPVNKSVDLQKNKNRKDICVISKYPIRQQAKTKPGTESQKSPEHRVSLKVDSM